MNVLLVDGHTLLRESVKELLVKWNSGATVDDYASADKASAIVRDNQYELIILKINPQNIRSLNSIARFIELAPESPLVCLMEVGDHTTAQRVIQLGSKGVITSSMSGGEFLAVLQLVLAGGVFIPSELMRSLDAVPAPVTDNPFPSQEVDRLANNIISSYPLTERQIEVLVHLAEGRPNKTISDVMGISINTVKAHLTSIFKILGVKNRTEVVSLLTRTTDQPLPIQYSEQHVRRHY